MQRLKFNTLLLHFFYCCQWFCCSCCCCCCFAVVVVVDDVVIIVAMCCFLCFCDDSNNILFTILIVCIWFSFSLVMAKSSHFWLFHLQQKYTPLIEISKWFIFTWRFEFDEESHNSNKIATTIFNAYFHAHHFHNNRNVVNEHDGAYTDSLSLSLSEHTHRHIIGTIKIPIEIQPNTFQGLCFRTHSKEMRLIQKFMSWNFIWQLHFLCARFFLSLSLLTVTAIVSYVLCLPPSTTLLSNVHCK